MKSSIREIERELSKSPLPEWIQEMAKHYREKGFFRPEDLRKLLGHPTKGVRVGPTVNLEEIFGDRKKENLPNSHSSLKKN